MRPWLEAGWPFGPDGKGNGMRAGCPRTYGNGMRAGMPALHTANGGRRFALPANGYLVGPFA
ncbi:MAG: hypothetical protein ABFE08_11930 [Armatimonadia bacterium]